MNLLTAQPPRDRTPYFSLLLCIYGSTRIHDCLSQHNNLLIVSKHGITQLLDVLIFFVMPHPIHDSHGIQKNQSETLESCPD